MKTTTIAEFLQSAQEKHDKALATLHTVMTEDYSEYDKLAGQILSVLLCHRHDAARLVGSPWMQYVFDHDVHGTLSLYNQLHHALFDDGDICFVMTPLGLQLFWVNRWDTEALHREMARLFENTALYDPLVPIVTMDWTNEEIPEKLSDYFHSTARIEFLKEALSARTWDEVAWAAEYARKKSCWDESWLQEVDTLRPAYAIKYRKLYGKEPPARTQEDVESMERLKERLQAKVAARALMQDKENP